MVHAIIVLPGTTGTGLLTARDMNPAPTVAPSPPPPPPPAVPPGTPSPVVWSTAAFQYAEAKDGAGVTQGAAALEQPLYAAIPSGYSDKDGNGPTGYVSLIQSIIGAAAKQHQTYTAMYTSWPTNAPPLAATAQQSWGLTLPLTGNAVIGWGYDWRQDNLATTAVMLQNFLYNLTMAGNVDKITLIGHSMGGLVSRAYLESVAISPKTQTTQDATILKMVDKLITLGTPHLGAPMALAPISRTLEFVKGLDGEVFMFLLEEILGTPSPETIRNFTTIIDDVVNSPGPNANTPGSGVSTYQLLPTGAFIQLGGNSYPIYPYNNLPPELIQLLNGTGLQAADLNAAVAFFNALSYTTNPNSHIKYECIYGVVDLLHRSPETKLDLLTKTTVAYDYSQSPSPGKLTAVRKDGGGDLIVPVDSAMFVGNTSITDAQRHKVWGADHITMPSNTNVQDVVNGLVDFAS